jgi:hypothetical protein
MGPTPIDWFEEDNFAEEVVETTSPANTPEQQAQFAQVLQSLKRAEVLLLNPIPEHIEEIGKLIEPAAVLIDEHHSSFGPLSEAEVALLRSRCRSVRILLSEALKIQWHRMRKLGTSHESYTVSGKPSRWLPCISSFNIEA